MVRCTVRGKTAKKNEMKSFNTEKKRNQTSQHNHHIIYQ